ncbi:MAG: FAD-dependent oxidoreductase, partial [Chthoniobacteraceae bacterium]
MNPLILSLLFCLIVRVSAETIVADVVVYGGTAAGVSAACTSARLGKKVVVAEFGTHIGGLTSGGLGWTDIGNKAAIGGFSRDFYKRLGQHYGKPEAWFFEPSVAERELRALLDESKVPVKFRQRLAHVKMDGARITEITMEDGAVYRGKMFIDATYEGDLMAKAGVKYMVGREANVRFDETINGIRGTTPKHQFIVPVDPYVAPGDPKSGLLPFISAEPLGTPGAGDASVQAYNFRLCLTKNPENRRPIEPPPGYDAKQYELLGRYFDALKTGGKKATLGMFLKIDMVTPEKTDINNNGAFSTDCIGKNYSYPDGDYATRETIWKEHENYIRGFLTFLANDPRVPEEMRREMGSWGFPKDEFLDTGGWPHAMYVRESRRMLSDYVMSERVCRQLEKFEDAVGLGAYNMDSHNCRRIVRDGHVENEGDVQIGVKPYPISYRSIVPKQAECENLFVPVCLSATHVAYGSIRMEPVFMIMGQSSATAACIAIDAGVPVQKVAYPQLREQLLKDGQMLEWTGLGSGRGEAAPKLPGLVLDDADAKREGEWTEGSINGSQHIGTGYIHDQNGEKGKLSLTWSVRIPDDGVYDIVLHFPPNANRATNVPVEVSNSDRKLATAPSKVNQREKSGVASLGKFALRRGDDVMIRLSNKDTDGYVVADGVQLLK